MTSTVEGGGEKDSWYLGMNGFSCFCQFYLQVCCIQTHTHTQKGAKNKYKAVISTHIPKNFINFHSPFIIFIR